MVFAVLSVILALILLGLVVLIVRLARAFAPMMGGRPTGELAPGLWTVRDRFVSAFLADCGDGTFIAVDAGMDPANFARQLAALPVDPAKVAAVYLTHADGDHFGARGLFPNAALVLPEPEEAMVTGQVSRRMLGRDMPMRVKFDLPHGLIADGETRKHGRLAIRAIHTPGHTPGSTSYLVNGKWLFTGDLLMLRNGLAETTWKAINNDTEESRRSLVKLAGGLDGQLDGVELLCSAHTGVSADWRAALAPWR